VFSLGPDGANFTVLHDFTGLSNGTNADGINPCGKLILSTDCTLYGTARYGGPSGSIRGFSPSPIGSGTIFSLKTNGAAFTVLHSFDWFGGDFLTPTNSDGASPVGNLLLDSDGKFLYGTAPEAGAGSSGTIFCVGTDGSDFTVLHAFNLFPHVLSYAGYGLYPYGGLVQGNDGLLYGACYGGGYPDGIYFAGTIYRLNPDGTGLALLHSFSGLDGLTETNVDGANPYSTLLKGNDGRFYGLTSAGGPNGSGTVFSFAPPLVLQINATNGLVALTWPASATNFVLETSSTIVTSTAWTLLTNGITTVNNNLSLTLPASGGAAFFRLHAKP
jgi:uncharacterized repeat protein (TIGR03803 family)